LEVYIKKKVKINRKKERKEHRKKERRKESLPNTEKSEYMYCSVRM
jgi:hypothetical protein